MASADMGWLLLALVARIVTEGAAIGPLLLGLSLRAAALLVALTPGLAAHAAPAPAAPFGKVKPTGFSGPTR